MSNAEITAIKQILGLKHGKTYTNVDELRYGKLMIMTDQVKKERHAFSPFFETRIDGLL